MRIHLYYQYYHNPDCAAACRHYHLAQYLAQQHEVTIITSDVWEKKRITRAFEWAPAGVKIKTIRAPYHNRMGPLRRLIAFVRYIIGAFYIGLKLPKPDLIIGTSTPLSAAWVAHKVAQYRGVPWVFEVRDLWPDFPIQMGAIPFEWMKNWLWRVENQLYHSADHIIPLSPDMENHILQKGCDPSKVTTLVNGTDHRLARRSPADIPFNLQNPDQLQGKKVILYAGTLGRANAIACLLEASTLLASEQDLIFVFIGEGYYEDEVKKRALVQKNILHIPPVPRHRIFDWYARADLSLVSFLPLPVLNANSPAKFFDSLAMATPVLVTNTGWTREFVEQYDCGWFCPATEPHPLALCIRSIIDEPELLIHRGKKGQTIADSIFRREPLFIQFEQILMQRIKYSRISA